jgi:hypothetical protein
MKTIYFEIPVDELELDFEYQPYEAQTREHEGCPESNTLVSCKFRGVEILDKLEQSDIEMLTEDKLESARDAELDHKIEAYLDRKNQL